jgi:tetratricopeptide (TPR) repeat protein
MSFRRSLPRLLLVAATVGGCAGTTRPTRSAAGDGAAVTPIHSEEELAAARADFEALGPNDPARADRRRAIVAYLASELIGALDHGRQDEADAPFKQMLTLYSPAELRASRPAADDKPVLEAARRIELAFRKRGAHAEVLSALAAQIALAPADAGARARFTEVTGWLENAAAGDEDGPDGAARVIDDLETIARALPAPFIVDELARRYRAPRAAAPAPRSGKPSIRALRELMGEDRGATRAYELGRLFLRVGDAVRARKELAALGDKTPLRGDDNELAQLLDKVNAHDAHATDWVGLSMFLVRVGRERGSDDRDVALRVCRAAEGRFEHAVEPRICAGKLALSLDQLVVAMKSFEAVRAIDPNRREVWEDLARIYQARLFQLVTEENLDVSGLPAELAHVEAFHAEAQKRFSQQPLSPGLAGAVFEVGRGYYNAGRIAEAERYLARSIELEPSAAALELAATVRLKRGDPQRAAVLLERAIHTGKGPKEDQLYHRAKLRRLLADAIEAAGDAGAAEQTRRGAVEDWDVLLELGLQKEFASDAYLERGKVLYQAGDRDEGLRSLARSIDTLPDRGSTYADVIAFLIPRGELAEALDAYHRALGRNEVTDYLKVYCSLWIVDLAQRAGQPEDPLALAYLRAADGGKWFDDLARWSTGRQSEAELIKHANTPGKRAEAAFYRALKALRTGHPDEARRLWKDVLATDMMAFFEFDMAGLYVKDGPPAQPRLPATRPVRAPKPSPPDKPQRPQAPGEPPPDGSI